MYVSRFFSLPLVALIAFPAIVNLTFSQRSIALKASPVVLASTVLNQQTDAGKTITVFSGIDLQAALDSATPGDDIVLEAGATYIAPAGGGFVLPNKANPANRWVTIRTSNMKGIAPEGERVNPTEHADSMPKILAQDNQAALKTEAGAHHYRLIGIEFGLAPEVNYNSGGLVRLGDSNSSQNTLDSVPHDIVIDRCYIHGSETAHAVRGIFLNSARTDILHSYISEFHGIGQDTQAIAGINGPGPFKIINNYLEAAGENVLFGGGDPKIEGLVPSDIEFRRNHVAKPVAWMEALIPAPSDTDALSLNQTGGSLAAGATYYYRVAARGKIGAGVLAISPASSTELEVTLGFQQNVVALSWRPVSYGGGARFADRYRIYRTEDRPDAEKRTWVYYDLCEQGTGKCGQGFQSRTADRILFTDLNAEPSGTGNPPKTGTRWLVKNLFELKNAQRVNIVGNIFENNWVDGQVGYAILLKSANQDGKCDWCVTQDIVFKNNIVRHSASAINILGRDPNDPSGRVNGIKIKNNLFYDIDGRQWGGGHGAFLQITDTEGVKVSHNTVLQSGHVLLAHDERNSNFKFVSNLINHNSFGVKGDGTGIGNPTLERYFSEVKFKTNVLIGGRDSNYPLNNYFPSSRIEVGFMDYENGNYRLLVSSPYKSVTLKGKDLGADIDKVEGATAGAATSRNARP